MAVSVMRSKRRYGRWLVGGLLAGGGLAGALSYARADTAERRRARVGLQGVVRFFRSISVGLVISLDYWWAGRGLDEVRTKQMPGIRLMWRCGVHNTRHVRLAAKVTPSV